MPSSRRASDQGRSAGEDPFEHVTVRGVGFVGTWPMDDEVGHADLLVAPGGVPERLGGVESGVEGRTAEDQSTQRIRIATDLRAGVLETADLLADHPRALLCVQWPLAPPV